MIDIDFLPPDYHQRRQSAQLPAFHVALAACVSIVLGIAVTTGALRKNRFGGEIATVNAAYAQANSDVRQLTQVNQHLNKLRRDAMLGLCLHHPVSRSRALTEIARQTPAGAQLTLVQMTPAAAPAIVQTSARPTRSRPDAAAANAPDRESTTLVDEALRPRQVVVEGEAESGSLVHQFVRQLEQNTPLENVELDMLRSHDQRFTFRIVARLQTHPPSTETQP